MKITSCILLCVLLISTNAQSITSGDKNIAFDLPDITITTIDENIQHIQLEAFRSLYNDKIIESNNKEKYGQLMWVTIGHPTLVKTSSIAEKSVKKLFHFTDEGFYVHIEMLTKSQRALLVQAVFKKYGIQITPDQIVHLLLSKFLCNFEIFKNAKRMIFLGEVKNFKEFPLRMDFKVATGLYEREVFMQRLNNDGDYLDIDLQCQIASSGVSIKTNTFSITATQISQLELVDKLFGPSNDVFVTREQMSALALDIYSSLNIIEDYQMPEYEFENIFIDDFIKQTSQTMFKQVNIDNAVMSLSKFALNFDGDLTPDIIREDFGKLLKITKTGNKSHIVLDNEGLEHLKSAEKLTTGGGGSAKVFGIFKASVNAKYLTDKSKDWLNSSKTLNDQLNELNSYTKDDMVWKFDGEKIVPKSINVAKIIKSSFSRSLAFHRIRRSYLDAPFLRSFSLYTQKALAYSSESEKLSLHFDKIDAKLNNVDNRLEELKNQVNEKVDKTKNQLSHDLTVRLNNIQSQQENLVSKVNSINSQLNSKIDNLDKVKVYSGRERFPMYLKLSSGVARVHPKFPSPFKTKPNVIVSHNVIDLVGGFRLNCWAGNIHVSGLTCACATWADTTLVVVEVDWLAVGI